MSCGRRISIGVVVAATIACSCSARRVEHAATARAQCGPAVAADHTTARPAPVVAAPEAGPGRVVVGEHYLAQQSGTSVLVWDLDAGTPTSITRDVQLRGVAADADRFIVERDQRLLALDPSGQLGAQIADHSLTDLRAIAGRGPVRYLGRFHETSDSLIWQWTDEHGAAEEFRFSIGCDAHPNLANPYDTDLVVSPNGATGAATSTLFDLNCAHLPPRVVTWSLANPAAAGRTFPISIAPADDIDIRVAAIANDGRLVALAGLPDGGLRLVRLAADGDGMEIVRTLVADKRDPFQRAAFVGGQLVASTATRTVGWDVATGATVWSHAGALTGEPLANAQVILADDDELALVSCPTGQARWRRRRAGAIHASRASTWIVSGPSDDGALVVIDAASGRTVRKLASAPLRVPRELAFTASGLVASDGTTLGFWSLERGALVQRVPYDGNLVTRGRDGRLVTVQADACPHDRNGERTDVWSGTAIASSTLRCDLSQLDRATSGTVVTTQPRQNYTAYHLELGDGRPSVDLAAVRGERAPLVLSRDGRRALSYRTDEDGTATQVSTFDTSSGELLAEVGEPLTTRERRDLFRGSIAARGSVTMTIDHAALSPDGALAAVSYRYTNVDQLNWSYATVDGTTSKVTVRHTDTGERAFADLDGRALGFVRPDVVLVSDGHALRLYRGTHQIAEAAYEGAAPISAAWTEDGSVIATGHADGMIRIWSTDGLVLRATLLDYRDDEWLAMTPGGAYAGTPEVGERVGWRYDAPLEPFRFEQFAAVLQRPDIVRTRLTTGAGDAEPPAARPPRLAWATPVATTTADATITVRLAARSPTRVDDVRFYVEGKPVAEATPCGDAELTATLPLAPGPNRVTAVAFDDRGLASNPLVADVTRTSTAPRPALWVIAVGVDHYPGLSSDVQLAAAVADAHAIADAFSAQAGPGRPFSRAHVELLEDARATSDAIAHAVDALADMQPDDVAIVFLAGHGVKRDDRGDMVFLTSDVRAPNGRLDQVSLARGTVSWSDLGRRIERAPGRVVMLVDACHAGHLDQQLLAPNDDLARHLASSGRAGEVVFAAAKGRQLSFETHGARGFAVGETLPNTTGARDGHGLFTSAVLDSLDDAETDRNGDGAVQLSELVDEVTWRVRRQTKALQTPWVVRRELFGDFVIAAAGQRAAVSARPMSVR